MFTLSIVADGETIVERRLLRFAENMEHPQAALEVVGDVLREATEKQFDSEGGYASGGWKELAQSTIDRKARLGQDPRILRATDRLMESLTRKFDGDHIEQISGDTLTFGSSVPYGLFHQSSRPRTKIPFRPPVAITEEDKRTMVKRVQQALLAEADKAVWGA